MLPDIHRIAAPPSARSGLEHRTLARPRCRQLGHSAAFHRPLTNTSISFQGTVLEIRECRNMADAPIYRKAQRSRVSRFVKSGSDPPPGTDQVARDLGRPPVASPAARVRRRSGSRGRIGRLAGASAIGTAASTSGSSRAIAAPRLDRCRDSAEDELHQDREAIDLGDDVRRHSAARKPLIEHRTQVVGRARQHE